MDFTLDEAHLAVAEVAADVLARGGETDSVWAALAKADLLGLALPEELGGAGLGVLATSLVLTESGRHASAVPALATLACGVLPVAAFGTRAQRENLLPPVASGERLLTAAPHEPGDPLTTAPRTTARRTADGFAVTGTKTGVPHASAAHRVLVPATTGDGVGVFLVDPQGDGVDLAPARVSGAGAEDRITFTDAPGELLGEATDGTAAAGLVAFALAGAVAYADGLLAGALDLTGTHVASREQFGRPLAAFQAVAQQVADVYVAARTLHLAARSACWRLDTGRDADEDLAVASYWLAEELLPALHTCHHLHGGLGVDVEYPMHRYFAAAVDLTRFVGGAAARGERMGELVSRARSRGGDSGVQAASSTEFRAHDTGMYLELTDDQRALKAWLRAYFATLLTPDERATLLTSRHGDVYRDVVRRLGRDGWLGVGWPVEYGGRGFGEIEQQIFVNEAARADVQLPSVTLQTVGPTLQEFGTEEQKSRFLPAILAGQVHFAIGYTEPEAGTDLASLRTAAVRDGDHWVVNGQKIFTTGGHDADFVWLAVRTDPDARRHRGISILIVDTTDPGYSWTPIITCDGAHHVNATYYENVRVPAGMLVGEVNAGWRLITTQLNHERVMLGPAGRVAGVHERVRAWAAARTDADGHPLLGRADVRAALGRGRACLRVNELLNWQVAASAALGPVEVADASATKVFSSERIQAIVRELTQLVGRHGDAAEPETAELVRWLDVQAKRNLVLTFGGGVNEIQRELIATAGLGLPRVPR